MHVMTQFEYFLFGKIIQGSLTGIQIYIYHFIYKIYLTDN